MITTICLVGTANSQEQKEIETPGEKIMTKGFGAWRLCYIESAAVSDVKFLEAM